jgi:hypothetical protein
MNKKDIVLLLFLSAIWSFSEIFIRNALISYEHHSAVLTGIAAAVISFAYMHFKGRRITALYLGLLVVAVLFVKWLVVPLGGVHYSCIVNSSLAILLDGLIFSGVLLIFNPGGYKLYGALSLSSFFIALVFRLIGIHLYPCNYLLSFSGAEGVIRFIFYEGGTWFLSVNFFVFILQYFATYKKKPYSIDWLVVGTVLLFVANIAGTMAGLH